MLTWILGGSVLFMAAFAAITVRVGWCPSPAVAGSQLLLPWWFLLTIAVVVTTAITGTWILAVAGVAVATGTFVVLFPKLHRSPRARPDMLPEASVSVTLANLYIDNNEPDEAINQLLDSAPDILVMTELTPDLVARFDELGGAHRFPHRIHPEPIAGEYVVGIFTPLDMLRSEVRHQGPLEVVEMDVRTRKGEELRVIAVHPEAPVGREQFRRWRRQLHELESILKDASAATIVLGDLNSGTLQPPFEHLVRSPFRDAHDELGVALKPSWGVAPWLPRWFPTLLARLDHLLVSPEVLVIELDDLDAVGSDHRPFRANLGLTN